MCSQSQIFFYQTLVRENLLFSETVKLRNFLSRISKQKFDQITFAVEANLSIPPQDDRHPLSDVVEIQNAEKLVGFFLKTKFAQFSLT